LFGTLDADDTEYYNAQIKHSEESEDMASMLKQQLSIVKASLGTVNNTMSDIEYNNRVIKEGVNKLKDYIEMFTTDTKTQLDLLDVKITVEGHIAHVNHAMEAIQRNLNLIIECIKCSEGYFTTTDSINWVTNGNLAEKCFQISQRYHGTVYSKQGFQSFIIKDM
jgi:hypothetical protein